VIARLLVVLLAGAAFAAEARLVLPDRFPPGAGITGAIEVSDAGKAVARIALPTLAGVTWERLPGTEVRQTITGASSHTTVRIPIRITVERAGELTIPSFAVGLHGGGELQTEPRMVTVEAGQGRLVGNAVCWAEFVPATALVGQPVTLRVTCAFADPAFQIQSFGVVPPEQAVVIAAQEERGEDFGADGRRWRTHAKRWTLTFAEPGEITVKGQQEYFPCQSFGGSYIATGPGRRMTIAPATLRVRAVPAGGRPEGWNGLVAPVAVEASLDRARIALGEGVRLRVRIRGPQADLIVRPPLPAIPGLAARAREDDATPVASERTFTWDLQPTAAGTYTVRPPAVPYFDPQSDAFRTASATAPILRVDPGTAATLTIAGTPSAVPAPEPATPAALTMPAPRRGEAPPAWPPLLLAAVIAGAAVAVAGLVTMARWRPKPKQIHRGHVLTAALRSGDLAATARAMQALRADLPAALTAEADAFEATLDAVRFGDAPAAGLATLARPLEDLP